MQPAGELWKQSVEEENVRNGVVLIPTLDPDSRLVPYVKELTAAGFPVILVNDGSHADREPIFDELRAMDGVGGASVKVLVHAINYGKGRGLKNGQNFYLTELKGIYQGYKGIVTADSDGQHLVKDVIHIDDELGALTGKAMIVGCRNFKLANVPKRSRYGNQLTRFWFRILYGKDITDTQTGLRAFTNDALYDLMELDGERYEYETNVLIGAVHNNFDIRESEIATVYENNNEGSHFNAFRDSYRIYKILFGQFFKYMAVALTSFLLELFLFWLLCQVIVLSDDTLNIWVCNIFARILSSIYNFAMNAKVVFSGADRSRKRMIIEYAALAIGSVCLSSLGISLLTKYLKWNSVAAKCIVDLIIFCINYKVQQAWIFRKTK